MDWRDKLNRNLGMTMTAAMVMISQIRLMMAANGLDGRKSAMWMVTGRRGFKIVGSNVKERNRLRISVKAAKRPIWR